MGRRVGDGERELMLRWLGQGLSCHEIGRRLGRQHGLVRNIAYQAGLRLVVGGVGGVEVVNRHRYAKGSRALRRIQAEESLLQGADQWRDGRGHLTRAARTLIAMRLREGRCPAAIARELGVHRSTLSRELRRCKGHTYSPQAAHAHMVSQKLRPKTPKLFPGTRLWMEVVIRLNKKHSPEQIANRLRDDFPDDPEMRVSHETIYQALYLQGAGTLRHELTVLKALRSGRTSRLPSSKLGPRKGRPWIGEAVISARPKEAADRAVPGHWEGDLVIGGDLSSALVTLNERTTRYTMIRRLSVHDSLTVTDAVTAMIQQLPTTLTRTLTWDQGSEMAQHQRVTLTTGCAVFFCDPHAPWQRPLNENSNGLIRDFFPKGTDFNMVTDDTVAEAELLLNTRPRKILNWATPAEKLDELLNVAPTT